MLGIILTPFYKAILILAAVAVVFGGGYYKGYKNTQEKFDAYKVEVASVVAQQEAKISRDKKQTAKLNKETSNAYKDNLSLVRQYYDRMYNNSSSEVSGISDAPSRIDGNPPYSVLIRDCSEASLQLISLQAWIKKQKEILE